MRIALLAPFAVYGPKGTARWRTLPLARALAAAGHCVIVVAPPYDRPEHAGRRWREGEVEVLHVPLAGAGLPHLAQAAGRMAQAALAFRPDLVHAFKPVAASGLAAALLLARPGGPPMVVDADDWEAGWAAAQGLPAPLRWLTAWQERWVLRRAKAVTVASRWLQRRWAALRGDKATVFYLPNGAETTLPPPPPTRAAGGRVLLYTRFVEHSPEKVWAVWRRVAAARPDARLWVAGRGLHREEATLLRIAEADGLAHTVRMLGWLPAISRWGVLAAADLALLPVADTPLVRAKSPMRLVDLLAAGVCVVTQGVGEYAEYVEHGCSGWLAPAGDDAALADGAVQLLADATLRSRLAAGAVQRVQERYLWRDLVQVAWQAYSG
ncbi:MAG: glycosyltransferase [Caldilineales bacterium]|nr:glycosyltransferase [Caldilineales bacterium]MDW8318931.1 glycosyltransferase [Anaerolineae bacterium]